MTREQMIDEAVWRSGIVPVIKEFDDWFIAHFEGAYLADCWVSKIRAEFRKLNEDHPS